MAVYSTMEQACRLSDSDISGIGVRVGLDMKSFLTGGPNEPRCSLEQFVCAELSARCAALNPVKDA